MARRHHASLGTTVTDYLPVTAVYYDARRDQFVVEVGPVERFAANTRAECNAWEDRFHSMQLSRMEGR